MQTFPKLLYIEQNFAEVTFKFTWMCNFFKVPLAGHKILEKWSHWRLKFLVETKKTKSLWCPIEVPPIPSPSGKARDPLWSSDLSIFVRMNPAYSLHDLKWYKINKSYKPIKINFKTPQLNLCYKTSFNFLHANDLETSSCLISSLCLSASLKIIQTLNRYKFLMHRNKNARRVSFKKHMHEHKSKPSKYASHQFGRWGLVISMQLIKMNIKT